MQKQLIPKKMNREIKFRAWSKATEKMSDWDFIHSVRNLHKLMTLNHIELMQFTGLADKNGKEIYEGDIVTHLHSPYTCVVRFQKETAMFLAKEIGDEKLGFGIEDVTEVIGNIYEDANLLQGVV
jgi:uncharacterized phage protein (TIGR01671 family)